MLTIWSFCLLLYGVHGFLMLFIFLIFLIVLLILKEKDKWRTNRKRTTDSPGGRASWAPAWREDGYGDKDSESRPLAGSRCHGPSPSLRRTPEMLPPLHCPEQRICDVCPGSCFALLLALGAWSLDVLALQLPSLAQGLGPGEGRKGKLPSAITVTVPLPCERSFAYTMTDLPDNPTRQTSFFRVT